MRRRYIGKRHKEAAVSATSSVAMLFGDPKTDNELRPNRTVKEGAEYVEEWTCPKKRYKSLGDDLSLIVVHRDSFYRAR
jgi:hypothetical protein